MKEEFRRKRACKGRAQSRKRDLTELADTTTERHEGATNETNDTKKIQLSSFTPSDQGDRQLH